MPAMGGRAADRGEQHMSMHTQTRARITSAAH